MTKNESSVVSNVVGVQQPGGKIYRKKLNKVSKPFYLDPELFERIVMEAELQGKNIAEVVRKKGSLFVMYDDNTGAEVAAYKDRDTAWEKQRAYRKRKDLEKDTKKKKKKKEKEHEKVTQQLFGKKKKAVPVPGGNVKKEELVRMFQKILLSESVLEYVFEQPSSPDVVEWDNFLKGLSKQTIMSDQKLKKIIGGLMNAEARIISKSMGIVKDRLSKAGFEIKQPKVGAQQEAGRLRGDFYVKMKEDEKELPFGIRIENGRPLIFIPDETRAQLNSSGTQESKLLRAELLSIQETVLDNLDDVVNATSKRDQYFSNLEKTLDKMINNLSPVEIALARKLMKTKYKNV